MHRLCFALWFGLTAGVSLRAGSVSTLDGRTFVGDIYLTNGFLAVTATNSETSHVALTNLLAADFITPDSTSATGVARGNGLLGFYFSNTNFDGTPLVRLDETIDFDWGADEPASGLPADGFGVMWCGEIEAPVTGDYAFTVSADDRAELFLDNQSIINTRQKTAAAEVFSVPVRLEAGSRHLIRMHYTDSAGPARVRLFWSGPGLRKGVVPKERLHARSPLPAHAANISTNHGLLGTYYRSRDFSGPSETRVDPVIDVAWVNRDPLPGFPRTNLSIRWSGQVKADHSEEYTFYVLTDDRVRLWIDDKLLLNRFDQFWLSESRGSLPLVAGEKSNIRLEIQNTAGDAIARLFWSSASVAKTNVPFTHLSPSTPAPMSAQSFTTGGKTPPGLLLRNGSFMACTIERATDTSLRVSGLLGQRQLSTVNISRILCQPLSRTLEARLSPGRTGVLLAKGDFVDGDFRGIENGRVSVSSVLFGQRSFDAKKEVLAIALRDTSAMVARHEIRLRDHSLLRPSSVTIGRDMAVLQDTLLGTLRLPASDLISIRRTEMVQ